jgi:hypothetical protein
MCCAAVAVGRAVACPSPAQIPACDITALGSSDTLASAIQLKPKNAIALSEVGLDCPALPSGQGFLCRLRVPVSPFPM